MINIKNKNKKKGFILFINGFLGAILIVIYISNIVIANGMTRQNLKLTQHLKDLKVLQIEQQKLAITATELQSIDRLSRESTRLQLVKAADVRYLRNEHIMAGGFGSALEFIGPIIRVRGNRGAGNGRTLLMFLTCAGRRLILDDGTIQGTSRDLLAVISSDSKSRRVVP